MGLKNDKFANMIVSKKVKAAHKITTFNRVLLTAPTERFILWALAKDSKLFNIDPLIKIGVKPDLMKAGADSNLSKALGIFQNLIDRGYINQNYDNSKITLKGQLYRLSTHPSLGLWTFIVALMIGVITIILMVRTPEIIVIKESPIPQAVQPASKTGNDTVPKNQSFRGR